MLLKTDANKQENSGICAVICQYRLRPNLLSDQWDEVKWFAVLIVWKKPAILLDFNQKSSYGSNWIDGQWIKVSVTIVSIKIHSNSTKSRLSLSTYCWRNVTPNEMKRIWKNEKREIKEWNERTCWMLKLCKNFLEASSSTVFNHRSSNELPQRTLFKQVIQKKF